MDKKMINKIFKVYGIKKAYFREAECLEVVIVERDCSLSLPRWLNFISALKVTSNKEVEFLSVKTALKVYGNLDGFTSLGEC